MAAQLNGDIATVELGHFSWGLFAWVDSGLTQFNEQLQKFLKWRFDPPACNNNRATLNGYELAARASENTLYACVEADGGKLRLSLYGNSPFTWDVFPKAGAAGEPPRLGVDWVAIVGSALFGLGAGHDFTQQTLLFPGSTTSVIGDPGDLTFSAEARINPTYQLAYATMAAVEMYLAVLGVDSKALAWKNVAECATAGQANSCTVSEAMRAAISDLPMASVPLLAECAGGWALVSAPMEEGGDLTVLLSPQGSGYRLYASFPSSTCRAQYRGDSGPTAFASRFPPC